MRTRPTRWPLKSVIFGNCVMLLLRRRGGILSYSDPHVPALPRARHHPGLGGMQSSPLTAELLGEQDCVLVVTDHTRYDFTFVVRHARLVVDTRAQNWRVAWSPGSPGHSSCRRRC